MPDVQTYCNDDVVRTADGEWQIGDAVINSDDNTQIHNLILFEIRVYIEGVC